VARSPVLVAGNTVCCVIYMAGDAP